MKAAFLSLAFFSSLELTTQCLNSSKPIKGILAIEYRTDSMDWYWNVGSLSGISTSSFQIEIRLYAHGLFDGTCYQLYCNRNQFAARVSSWDTSFKTIMLPVANTADLKRIFHRLLKNKIFELPDEQELHFDKSARDGIHYMLEYNVGGICRRYKFSNPRIYHQYYPDIPALNYYNNISRLFQSLDSIN